MENINEKLIEPLKYYYEEIKDNFSEKIVNFFEELVAKSNINIEENMILSKEYEELALEKDKISRKFKNLKIFATILITVVIISIILAIFFYFSNKNYLTRNIIFKIIFCLVISTALFIFRFTVLAKKIELTEQLLKEFEEKCSQKLYECYHSMLPLNELMDSKYTFELINKNIPFVKFDPYFDMKRFEEMYYVYGMHDNSDTNFSTLEAASGHILGNPFVLLKEMKHEVLLHEYKGSLTISWSERRYNYSTQKYETVRRSETLYATIKKPKPVYSNFVSLIFANDVASNLTFNRYPGHIEKLSESALNKKIKKQEKKLNKLEEKSIAGNSSFMTMSNTKFEVLFNALDRTNETEFRLLFTPLAQKNMISLLKNKDYGDNFYFGKNKKINTIIAEHTANWDLNLNVDKFKSYSYEKCKDFFINFNKDYFDKFFFTLLPLISIPLYQQYMAGDYIYNTEFKNNYNPYTVETLANNMKVNYFTHPNTQTNAILKASPLSSTGETDLVNITAYSYRIEPRVEYVSVKGGDGYYHDVPVNWDEYIPLSKESTMEIKKLEIDDIKFEQLSSSTKDINIFTNKELYTYKNKIFAKLTNNNFIEAENLLNSILKNFKL